ncbi:hypothetical protein KY345_06635 [Candidatus Woesearchaeota archaeon]|nr:hypothetical protein [Candidatus Woesearchaeota archaeon]
MEDKKIISTLVVMLAISVLFLGVSITGHVVQKVDYSDLCSNDNDCEEGQCCIIYEDHNLGLCRSHCASFEFLCKSDDQCEEENVCCISEGMDYGICNTIENCQSVDLFGIYAGNYYSELKMPRLESPAQIDKNNCLTICGIVWVVLVLAFIAWMLLKNGKKKRK